MKVNAGGEFYFLFADGNGEVLAVSRYPSDLEKCVRDWSDGSRYGVAGPYWLEKVKK